MTSENQGSPLENVAENETPTPRLKALQVKSPCSEDWNAMTGDEQRRFCEICNKHVHNLSAMTAKKAEKLLKDKEGSLCVRYQVDENGHKITRQRFEWLQKHSKAFSATARVAVAAVVALAISPFSWANEAKKAPCPVDKQGQSQQQYKLGKPAINHNNTAPVQPADESTEMGKPVAPPRNEDIMGDVAEPPAPSQGSTIQDAGRNAGSEMGSKIPAPEMGNIAYPNSTPTTPPRTIMGGESDIPRNTPQATQGEAPPFMGAPMPQTPPPQKP